MERIKISIIVATAEGNLIGNTATNKTPWYLPKDLKHFKETTAGSVMISGRKTYESFGRNLPGREHIIVSRDPNYVPLYGTDFTHVCGSLEEAVHLAQKIAGSRKIFIVGGGEIYAQALSNHLILVYIDKIYKTEVEGKFAGDVFFPELSVLDWTENLIETVEPDEKNPYRFAIKEYVHFPMNI
jgi:dihydrofolate reductase